MKAVWRAHERSSGVLLLDHLLALRLIKPDQLVPDFQSGLHDPFLLPDMEKACQLVAQAREESSPVAIFGDYDADGTPASALLALLLERLGISYQVFLPTRRQGYGLSRDAVDGMGAAKLLITVDTGITAVEEIAYAKSKGMRVIVLDHHLPKNELPVADALIDPFLPNSGYPFPNLCGCALAYKLAVALGKIYPELVTESFCKWLLDLVAISTVADMMAMRGENRVLVHYGLKVLRHNRRWGLRALLSSAGLEADNLTASSLGYAIGPRLNASGRLADNRPAYELLMAKEPVAAERWALELEKNNRERQTLVEKNLKVAEQLLFEQNTQEDRCYLVVSPEFSAGIVGLVAGKLAARHHRPVLLASQQGDSITGSARSVGDYSIIDGLTAVGAQLKRFGGHRQAAGFGLAQEDWPKFVDGLKSHAQSQISPDSLLPRYTADAVLSASEIALDSALECEKLEPFGLENNQPLFVIPAVKLGTPKSLGATGAHLKWFGAIEGVAEPVEIIGFGLKTRFTSEPLAVADLLAHLECNRWNGTSRLQLRLVDYRAPGEPLLAADKS